MKQPYKKPQFFKNFKSILLVFFAILTYTNAITAQVDEEKWYYIEAKHSGKVLEVPAYSKENGTVFEQNHLRYKDNQTFQFQYVGGGYYYILAKHSGKALDVSAYSQDNGALFHQWEIADGDNQKFKLADAGDGYYYIISKHSGKGLDVSGISTENGAKFHQWEIVGGDNQKFRFIEEKLPTMQETGMGRPEYNPALNDRGPAKTTMDFKVENNSDWDVSYRFVFKGLNPSNWYTVKGKSTGGQATTQLLGLEGVEIQWKDGLNWKSYGNMIYYIHGKSKAVVSGQVFPPKPIKIDFR